MSKGNFDIIIMEIMWCYILYMDIQAIDFSQLIVFASGSHLAFRKD